MRRQNEARNDEARSCSYFGNALTRAVTRKSRPPPPPPPPRPRPYSEHLFRELQFKFLPARSRTQRGWSARRGATLICHGTNSRILRILVHRTPATASRTCNPLRGPWLRQGSELSSQTSGEFALPPSNFHYLPSPPLFFFPP